MPDTVAYDTLCLMTAPLIRIPTGTDHSKKQQEECPCHLNNEITTPQTYRQNIAVYSPRSALWGQTLILHAMKKLLTLKEAIIAEIKREDKFSLHYILQAINHKKYFHTYSEFYTKPQLRELVIEELTANDFAKAQKLANYRHLIQEFNSSAIDSFPEDIRVVIRTETLETKPFKYRAKVLLGQEIVLKETPEGTPVKKFIIGDWETAEKLAGTLNRIAHK